MADNANTNIFHHVAGQPLHIFVEPTELTFRPKLIRDLRNRGAKIAHYPTDAQVIIVDPESDAGQTFIKDWSSEPGKVVLHHDWVTKSIAEGRALLGHDDWGGMRLLAGNNEHDANLDPVHPLPTPPPDNGERPRPEANLGDIQLPAGAPITGQALLQANDIAALTQNVVTDPARALAQLIQQMGPAVLQNILAQTQQANSAPAVPPVAGPSNHLAAYDGPQMVPPGVAATDFMPTPSSSSISVSTPRHSRSSPDPPSSIPAKRRKSLGDQPISSASSRSKGKGRAVIDDMPEPAAKHRRHSPASNEDECLLAEGASPREPEAIFIHDDGTPIAFWVQMETKQRGDLVHLIKKNKGRVVSDIAEADIAVLTGDVHWNKMAAQSQKVVVQSRYIRQCVQQCALLNPDEFGVQLLQKSVGFRGRARGRPPGSITASRSQPPIAPPSPRAFRISASPPPPEEIENWQNGKFLYTSEEIEYFRQYVPILLSRDPDASTQFICDKLHEKMPHHSTLSWRSWISREPRPTFLQQCRDMAFKYGNGQSMRHTHESTHRRRENVQGHERHATPEHANMSERATPSKQTPAEEDQVLSPAQDDEVVNQMEEDQAVNQAEEDRVPNQAEVDARDFDVITNFLAGGGADDRTDEEVWEYLAQQHPTRTAAEWQGFWLERGAEINDEVRNRMDHEEAAAVQNTKEHS